MTNAAAEDPVDGASQEIKGQSAPLTDTGCCEETVRQKRVCNTNFCQTLFFGQNTTNYEEFSYSRWQLEAIMNFSQCDICLQLLTISR